MSEPVTVATYCLLAVYIRAGGAQISWLLIEFNHSLLGPILSKLFGFSPLYFKLDYYYL